VKALRKPLFSVVVPTCGRKKKLKQALESVIRQTFDDWECLLVNDDPSRVEPVEDIASALQNGRIRILHNHKNCGVSRTRNAGITASRGKLIAFLDDDDLWLKDHLQRHFEAHRSSVRPRLAYSDLVVFWDDHVLHPRRIYQPSPPTKLTGHLLWRFFGIMSLCGVTVPKAQLMDAGMFDPEFRRGEDRELYVRLARTCEFHRINDSFVFYRKHLHGQQSGYTDARLAHHTKLMDKHGAPASARRRGRRKIMKGLGRDILIASFTNAKDHKWRSFRRLMNKQMIIFEPLFTMNTCLAVLLPFPLYRRLFKLRFFRTTIKNLGHFLPYDPALD
jgi:glycosyltransferase involved in cell wall biosynthesis